MVQCLHTKEFRANYRIYLLLRNITSNLNAFKIVEIANEGFGICFSPWFVTWLILVDE
jgi:hypothetical protein